MSRLRWWALVAVAVAIAAFVTGLLRGVTGTSPFDLGEGRSDLTITAGII